MSKEKILKETLSDDELENVSGGYTSDELEYAHYHCTGMWERSIYENSFPNCAATVEDGSWCEQNDACYSMAVDYIGMKDCSKAWS